MKEEINVSDVALEQNKKGPTIKRINSEMVGSEIIASEMADEIRSQQEEFKHKIQKSSRIRSVIRNKISQHKDEADSDVKLGNLVASMSRSMNRNISNRFTCQICLQSCKEVSNLYVSSCLHKQSYCQSCMHDYTIYMVNQFQEVSCPNSQCDQLIDTDGKFFRALPLDIQKKYNKIHNFHLTLKDSSLKLCPREDCDGIIRKDTTRQSSVMHCDLCKGRYCGQCLMVQHVGLCDDHETDFLVQNLKYKKCRRCGFVIQKNQGCNHMTCKCGHQFCYVCSADWAPVHYNDHNQEGLPAEGVINQPEQQQDQNCCTFILRVIIVILLVIFVKIPLTILLIFMLVVALCICPCCLQGVLAGFVSVWSW